MLYPPADRVDAAAAVHTTIWRERSTVWRDWGKGPPVLLVHGGFGSWTHWAKTIPALSPDRRVLAPDMPGFGESENPTLEDGLVAIPGAMFAGLNELVDLNEGIDIVGFSFGTVMAGALARQLYDENPAYVRSLTLIAPAGLGIVTRNFDDLERSRPNMSDAEIRELHRRNLGIIMFGDPGNITEETIDLQIANTSRTRVSGKPYSRSDALIRACDGLGIGHIDFIWGTKDAYALRNEPKYSTAVRAAHPDARIHHIDGAGHWAQYEAPHAINNLLLDILEAAN